MTTINIVARKRKYARTVSSFQSNIYPPDLLVTPRFLVILPFVTALYRGFASVRDQIVVL